MQLIVQQAKPHSLPEKDWVLMLQGLSFPLLSQWVCKYVNLFTRLLQRWGKTMANKVTEVLNLYAALTMSSNI